MIPVFLEVSEVIAIHDEEMAEKGGLNGMRDENLLHSAVAQPQNEHSYGAADLFQCAAAYAFHIAQNQPFLDGNKRTGLTACLTFLLVNGVDLAVAAEEVLDQAVWGFAEGTVTKESFAALLRRHAVPLGVPKR